MSIHRRANILVLAGIYASDFDVAPDVPLEPEPEYNEIPKKFTSVESWPKSTNLKCWSCDLIPRAAPSFIPQNPEIVDGKEVCDVLGNFCHSGCAAEYIYTKMPSFQHWDLIELLGRFECQFTGVRRAIIPRGPDKTEMKAYCGNRGLTVKQWLDKVDTHARDYSSRLGAATY